jgi:C4-dicarboxylate-specific signal transduction histidine kinase
MVMTVTEVVMETLKLCQERFKLEEVELRLPREKVCDANIKGRKSQLIEVILNLLNNALEAANKTPVPWVKMWCNMENNHFNLYVQDSGEGLSEEIVSRMFDPFFTTKEIGTGSGLGVCISQGILKEHNGSICYELIDNNTTFVITLPLAS